MAKSAFTGYIIAFLIGIGLTSGSFYLYQSLTTLPSWYQENEKISHVESPPVQHNQTEPASEADIRKERPEGRSYLSQDVESDRKKGKSELSAGKNPSVSENRDESPADGNSPDVEKTSRDLFSLFLTALMFYKHLVQPSMRQPYLFPMCNQPLVLQAVVILLSYLLVVQHGLPHW